MRRLTYISAMILLSVVIAVYSWHSDGFQRRFFPQRYWQEEVARLEETVAGYERFLEWKRFELLKQQLTLDANIQQALLTYSIPRRGQKAVEIMMDDLKEAEDTIRFVESSLEDTRKDLREAKRALAQSNR